MMKFIFLLSLSLTIVFTQDIAPELKRNVLRFPYGVLFKYTGKLTTNVERVWVVNKITLPKLQDIDLAPIKTDLDCSYFEKKLLV